MGQFLSSLSLAVSLRVPLALSFLLPWTVSPPRPSVDNVSSSAKAESSGRDTDAEGSSSKSSRISSTKEGKNGNGSKRKASVSTGTTPSKRQHLPRRKASILIHAATDDDVTSATELSSSSSASSDSEGPEHAPNLTPLPPPVARPRPIPNSYWATPLLLACEYPWCPRTASASGTERPPKLDALLKAGVRCFVDLTEPGELSPYHVDSSKSCSGVGTPTTESKQTASVLLQRCAVLGIPAEDVSYYRFPIQDRSLPPIISASSSTSSASTSSSSSSSPPSPTASSKCPLLSRALALLSANAAQGKITAVHCRGGIGRTGVVVGCFFVHSGYVSSGTNDLDGDEAGENALRLIEREWKGVAKCTRYPQSPETGPQVEYVRHYRREVPYPAEMGEKISGSGMGTGKTTSVAVQFEAGKEDVTRMITTTTTTTCTALPSVDQRV